MKLDQNLWRGVDEMKLAQENWLLQRPIAHRGLHQGRAVPENSLQAFERAAAKGYPVELDVHLLADGGIAVFHDDDLLRLTGTRGALAAQNRDAIKKLHLYGTDQTIPTLDEVFEVIAGKIPILIEVKNEGKIGVLEQSLLDTLKGYRGEFAVQSFNPLTIQWFKKHAPEIIRGQLACDLQEVTLKVFKKFLLRSMYFLALNSPMFVAYDIHSMPNRFTNRLHSLHIPIIAWTVDSEALFHKAEKYAQNIIFEGIDPASGLAL